MAKYFINLTDEIQIKFVKISSDSSSALLALRNCKVRSRVVLYSIKALSRLASKGIYVSLVWIKAHDGHCRNERADELAKRGTELDEEQTSWVARPFFKQSIRVMYK